jgi:hypothetical protein
MSAPKHAPRVPFALLVTGLIVGGLVLLLGLNTASAANELKRHNLAEADATVGAQVQELQNEVAASAAPAHLAAAAAALGMVPAGNPAFLVLGADGTVRVMGSPAPATAAPVHVATPPEVAKPSTHTPASSAKKKATKHAKPSGTARTSSSPAKHRTSGNRASKHTTSSSHPTPTPTPTPTVTLPGGAR